jgi:glycosyltransferase involved in cell wall biosynthesis
MSLVTFEPKSEAQDLQNKTVASELRNELAAQGIDWHWLRYHKRPSVPATAWDTLRGTVFTWRFIKRNKIDLLHGRVHLATLMAAVARKFSRRKPKLLFDIRGFFPEEYTDAGTWPEGGWLYRMAKRVEKWLLKEADGFVVLTERAREILFPESKPQGLDQLGRPVEVIPCCVDLERFALAADSLRGIMRQRLGVEDRRVIVYVGSFGGWYLTNEMLDLFEAARAADPATFVLILTQRDKDKVAESLRRRGFSPDNFLVDSVAPDEIPAYLAASDTAVSFIKACYSKLSSSPTKIAEYLAAGLPIVANPGVGDVDRLIEGKQVGAIINDFTPASYSTALAAIEEMGDVRSRCQEAAAAEFDLVGSGGVKYRSLYNRMLEDDKVGKD